MRPEHVSAGRRSRAAAPGGLHLVELHRSVWRVWSLRSGTIASEGIGSERAMGWKDIFVGVWIGGVHDER